MSLKLYYYGQEYVSNVNRICTLGNCVYVFGSSCSVQTAVPQFLLWDWCITWPVQTISFLFETLASFYLETEKEANSSGCSLSWCKIKTVIKIKTFIKSLLSMPLSPGRFLGALAACVGAGSRRSWCPGCSRCPRCSEQHLSPAAGSSCQPVLGCTSFSVWQEGAKKMEPDFSQIATQEISSEQNRTFVLYEWWDTVTGWPEKL